MTTVEQFCQAQGEVGQSQLKNILLNTHLRGLGNILQTGTERSFRVASSRSVLALVHSHSLPPCKEKDDDDDDDSGEQELLRGHHHNAINWLRKKTAFVIRL